MVKIEGAAGLFGASQLRGYGQRWLVEGFASPRIDW
jgi:hypothetical protein